MRVLLQMVNSVYLTDVAVCPETRLLLEIKVCEKFFHGQIDDIPRIEIFAEHRYRIKRPFPVDNYLGILPSTLST